MDAVELLAEVTALDPEHYRAPTGRDDARPVVEGSQILAQCIVAAMRRVPERRVVSSHMVFARPVDTSGEYEIMLDPISDGRTFACIAARALQHERVCATGTLLLDITAPDVIRHAITLPDDPGPAEAEPYGPLIRGAEIRISGGLDTSPQATPRPAVLDAWIRFEDVPDDPAVSAGLLALPTGALSIATALLPHEGIGQDQAHQSLSTAVNAITLSLHASARPDRWMRYHHRSTHAGGGMTHSVCDVRDHEGSPLASFAVDAMVRHMAAGTPTGARRL
jgi:acyl-CoA thioesterase